MIVSWNWLKDYLPLEGKPDPVVNRLMMAGLNHEGTDAAGSDWAIDLEITSNRPDCLGHLGVAREIAVLCDLPLKLPAAAPRESADNVSKLAKVRIDCPALCYRYTARVIRGAKVRPSPPWLADRLQAIGIAVINNVVDLTNYVMLECGQPLHAFDLTRLRGREIIVREARKGEPFLAIDHKTYTLEPGMCVIADAQVPVALGGVMGGADSEVSERSTELLLESAEFAPTSIRGTARHLGLHSPSSYRFERGVDPEGLDWASRRCCELILDLAGGELAEGVIDVGRQPAAARPIVLRLSQLPKIMGIDVPTETVRRILTALGLDRVGETKDAIEVTAPSWRRDLTREIDLVEEVARIYGYEKIPEDRAVPMCPSHRRDEDRVMAKIRSVLTSAGMDEAVTASVTPEEWCTKFTLWTDAAPLVATTPMLKGADRLRVSLIPSLLDVRRVNESVGNPVIELFETARIYLPRAGSLPLEQMTLGITSGGDFLFVKGIVEALLEALHIPVTLEVQSVDMPLLNSSQSCRFMWDGKLFGVIGEMNAEGLKQFGLRGPTAIAEVSLEPLMRSARLVPHYAPLSPYPAISRDVNLIVEESVRWSDLAATVRAAGGQLLEQLTYRETYRDAAKDGPGNKRLLFSFSVRSPERTLTSEEADRIRDDIVTASSTRHGARLLA